MAFTTDEDLRHLFRRAGFGASPSELELYRAVGPREVLNALLDFDTIPDDVDAKIGQPGYARVMVRGEFKPNTNITDARQRWLFRMLHTERPLQEKLTLFWHNHFATAYSKVAGAYGSSDGTRLMAAKPSEDPVRQEGQIELIRRMCMGPFDDFLVAMAKDVAMLVWLDGRFNTKAKPQENFGRELMELFTMGVRLYVEADVYAAARVFTGWNLRRTTSGAGDPNPRYEFSYNAAQHDTTAKAFSFPIYPDGGRTIPARSSADGLQDGIDLIRAVASHPETAKRLARRLYGYFVSEVNPPDEVFIADLAAAYLQNNLSLRSMVGRLLRSSPFHDAANFFSRYSWPVEFAIRAVKELGWIGFNVNDVVNALTNMGQLLFEPPDVAGWELGPGWISSGAMLARANFAATLTTNQRTNLLAEARPHAQTPEALLAFMLDRLSCAPLDQRAYDDLRGYVGSTTWTGSDTQVRNKAAGLAHLILGAGEYVFV
ncbi:MAG: DUF1800 domain-containing protein [Acidobacteriota bacterium]